MNSLRLLICLFAALPWVGHAVTLISPQDAIKLATFEKLTLKGKFVSLDSESGSESCVFENSEMIVVYDYCMKEEEAPATSIRLYPKRGHSSINLYAEANEGNVSEVRRDIYDDNFWRVAVVPNRMSFHPGISLQEHAQYAQAIRKTWGCTVLSMQNFGVKGNCNTKNFMVVPAQGEAWLKEARAFWDAPSEEWYELLKELRTVLSQTE